jgi:hypothetical protein
MVGFALVVILSVLPWSRFGDSSRYFGAWTFHWSLIAVVGGLGGLAVAVIGRYLSIDPRVEGSVYAVLAVVVAAAAILHYRHPPLLSDSTAWPLVAVVAAAVAGVGAALKWSALLSIRRHPA